MTDDFGRKIKCSKCFVINVVDASFEPSYSGWKCPKCLDAEDGIDGDEDEDDEDDFEIDLESLRELRSEVVSRRASVDAGKDQKKG